MSVVIEFDHDRIYDLSDLSEKFGLERWAVTRLVEKGVLQQIGTGCYVSSDFVPGLQDEIAVVALRCRHAVVHLHSAADLHGLSNRSTPDVYVAVPAAKRSPSIGGNFIAGIKASRIAKDTDFSVGVETMRIRGVDVSVTTRERTVCDMWRNSSANPSLRGDGIRIGMGELDEVTSAFYATAPDAADRLARTMEQLRPGSKAMHAFVDYLRTFGSGYRSGKAA